jgi:hypothetical protein
MKTAQTEEEEMSVEMSEVIRAAPEVKQGEDMKAAEEETVEMAKTTQAAPGPTPAEAQDPGENESLAVEQKAINE